MLQFSAHVKKKRRAYDKCMVQPFPSCVESSKPFQAVFVGMSVQIIDKQVISALSSCGCYGKGSRSRMEPQIALTVKDDFGNGDSLWLDLEESFFLAYFLKVLQIRHADGHSMNWQQMLQASTVLKTNFTECFVAYLYLKSRNWVIKSGIKFGGDFLIYKKGPHICHGSFVVLISSEFGSTNMAPIDIKGLQRIAETTDKDVLLLEITAPSPEFHPNSLEAFSNCSLTETVIRRFNYNAFVQSQNLI